MEKIDPKLVGTQTTEDNGLRFYNVRKAPFRVYGLIWESPEDHFRRMPKAAAKAVSGSVYTLHEHTSGGRVRFTTNSTTIAVRAKLPDPGPSAMLPQQLKAGFDVYVTEKGISRYCDTIKPPLDWKDGFTAQISLPEGSMRDITIYMPLYGGVYFMEVGLDAQAQLSEGGTYRHETPVLFYGSSITQGATATRPGSCYTARIARNFDCDFVNLGFSGSAKGEMEMAEYIAKQPMSLFVMDYDHNSPDAEHLRQHHEPFFQRIRQENPQLPILMVSRPPIAYEDGVSANARYAVIRQTYENARSKGDDNVYMLDGQNLFFQDIIGFGAWDCTADRVHPNDLGFFLMACGFTREIGKIMGWPVLDQTNRFLKDNPFQPDGQELL